MSEDKKEISEDEKKRKNKFAKMGANFGGFAEEIYNVAMEDSESSLAILKNSVDSINTRFDDVNASICNIESMVSGAKKTTVGNADGVLQEYLVPDGPQTICYTVNGKEYHAEIGADGNWKVAPDNILDKKKEGKYTKIRFKTPLDKDTPIVSIIPTDNSIADRTTKAEESLKELKVSFATLQTEVEAIDITARITELNTTKKEIIEAIAVIQKAAVAQITNSQSQVEQAFELRISKIETNNTAILKKINRSDQRLKSAGDILSQEGAKPVNIN